jgi:hypothetical protein
MKYLQKSGKKEKILSEFYRKKANEKIGEER